MSNNMFNRILSLILAFVMVAGVFPVSALAEEGGNDADLKQDNSLVIVSNEIDLNTLIHGSDQVPAESRTKDVVKLSDENVVIDSITGDELANLVALLDLDSQTVQIEKRMVKAAPAAISSKGTNTGYAAFDITPAESVLSEGQTYEVTVPVGDIDLTALVPDGALFDGVTYTLLHVEGNTATALDKDAFTVSDDGNIITSFTFATDSFSPFVLKYTVDFHYNGKDYSIEGNSQILLSALIKELNIMNGDVLLNVADVASVQFSDEHLVAVEQVSGWITYNDNTDVFVGEKDFLLSSEAPFTSEEALTLTLTDGTVIEINVTDDQEVDQGVTAGVYFLNADGTRTSAAETESGNTLNARINLSNSSVNSSDDAYVKISLAGLDEFVTLNEKFKENEWDSITFRDMTTGDQYSIGVYYDPSDKSITYSVPPGATGIAALSFTTPNGITENNKTLTLTPTLVDSNFQPIEPQENDEIGEPASGRWTSTFGWDPVEKYVNNAKENQVVVRNNNGTPVIDTWLRYDYHANSLNRAETGVRWTDQAIIEDTLTLPKHMSFTGDYTCNAEEGRIYIDGAPEDDNILFGLTLKENMECTELSIDKATNTIHYKIVVTNPNKNRTDGLVDELSGEMDNIQFITELNAAGITLDPAYITEDMYGEEIINAVSITETPNKGTETVTSDDQVKTKTKQDDGFKLEKESEQDGQYVEAGNTIDYTIRVTNTGTATIAAEDSIVHDTLPSAVYLPADEISRLQEVYGDKITIDGNNITFRTGELAAGGSSELVIHATVTDSKALENQGYTNESTITNTATYRGLSDYVASKLHTGRITAEKTSDMPNTILQNGETVNFTLTAKNETDYNYTGEVTFSDDFPAYLRVTIYDETGADITAATYATTNQTIESGCYVRDSLNHLVPATVVINGDGSSRIVVKKTEDGIAANSNYSIILSATYDESKVRGNLDANGNVKYTNTVEINKSQDHTDITVAVGKIDVDKYVSGAVNSDGTAATSPFSDETVVTYTIHVTNDATNPYKHDIVVTDTMPRGLVPVGLTVNGTTYTSWQDFVNAFGWEEQTATISDGSGSPLTTRIKQENNGLKMTWTIPNSEENPITSATITYQAVVKTDELVNPMSGVQVIENTVKIPGREDKEIILVDVKGVEISKKIVGANGELLDTIEISPGSRVTYELTIENPEHLNTTVTGITDYLPQGGPDSVFPPSYWQLGINVFVDETTDGKNQFVLNAAPNYNTDAADPGFGKSYWFDSNHYLRFGDIDITSAQDRFVQRITLVYPDDATVLHSMFADTTSWGRQQKNIYSVDGLDPVDVDHTELSNKKYYVQKSVIALSKDLTYNYISRNSKDLFSIGDVSDVFYTVVVANTGTGTLHINSLTDLLPAELEFAGIAANDYNAGTHSYNDRSITTIDHYSNANYVLPTGYTGLGGVSVTAIPSTGNTVLFTLNDDAGVDLPEKTILAFDIQCHIKDDADLVNGQPITNTIQANLDSDAAMSRIPITTQRTPDNSVQNNGGCEVVSNDGSSQTAESSVSIHPSNIAVPGILKKAIAYKSQNDTEWTNLNDNTTNINSQSEVKWKITLYNDGTVPLDQGYTLSDSIYEHHYLSGIESFTINGSPRDVNADPFTTYTTTKEGHYNKYVFTFLAGEPYVIPAGGKAELVIVTSFTTGQYQGQLDNEAVFSPVQSWDSNRVIHGQLEKNEAGTEYVGVSSLDYVNMLGDGATMSYKVVAEKNDPTNKAFSYDIATGMNFITIDGTEQTVTYTNHVQNLSNATFKKFVMIDRMPEINDTGVVNASEHRGSEYSMEFAVPLNLSLTFRNSDGTESLPLKSEDYTIEYSNKTAYTTEDWEGTSSWSGSAAGAKSFRLKLNADSLTAKINALESSTLPEAVFPSQWVLEVSYDGRPSSDGTAGQYAWNSFGYHYTTAADVPLSAEPPKVGVRIKPLPVLKKQVVDSQGVDQGIDTSVQFTYKFYEGAHTLEDLESLTPIWETTLYQGQAVKLLAKKTVNGVPTGYFTEGQTYTVVEEPAEGYTLVGYEKDGLKQTTEGYCVFQYSNELNTTIVCQNRISGFAPEADKILRARAPRTLQNEEFTFELRELSNVSLTDLSQTETVGNLIESVRNDATGHVQFNTIEYTEAGTYYYLMQEAAGSDTTVNYDDGKYLVVVEVTAAGARYLATGEYYKITDSDEADPVKAIQKLAAEAVPEFVNTESTKIQVEKVWAGDVTTGSATMVLYRTTGENAETPTNQFAVTINATLDNIPAGSGYIDVSYTGDKGDSGSIRLNNANGWSGRTVTLNRGEVYSFSYTADGTKVTAVYPESTAGVSDTQTIDLSVTANAAAQYTYTFNVPSGRPDNSKGSVVVTMNGQSVTLSSANNWTAAFTLTEETAYSYTTKPGDGFVTAVSPASGRGTVTGNEVISLTTTNAAQTMDVPVSVNWSSDPDAGTAVTVTFTNGSTTETATLSGSDWYMTKKLARLDESGNLITWNVSAAVTGADNASVSGAPATIRDSGEVALTGEVSRGMDLTVYTVGGVNIGGFYKGTVQNGVVSYSASNIAGSMSGYGNTNYYSSLDVKFDNGNDIYYIILLYTTKASISTDLNEIGYTDNAKEDTYTTRSVVYFKAEPGVHTLTLTSAPNWSIQGSLAASTSPQARAFSAPRLSFSNGGATRTLSAPSSGSVTFADISVGGSGTAFTAIQGKDLPDSAEIVPDTDLANSDTKTAEATIDGEGTLTWSNLPAVDENGNPIYYYVVEKDATADADEMSVRYAYTYNTADDPTSGISKVTITNTTVKRTGNLSVTKTVASGSTSQAFSFTVTLGTSIDGTYGDMSFTNGVANFALSDGQTMTATGLPAGISYTVVETTPSG